MAGQKPRQGWIYFINPYRVSLRCRVGHTHIYDLDEPGEVQCQTISCTENINSSRVFRGTHPYVVWTGDEFQDESGYIATFSVIPLTSQTTSNGLPTTLLAKTVLRKILMSWFINCVLLMLIASKTQQEIGWNAWDN